MIGALRERVTLQSPIRTADGAGGAAVTWDDGVSIWAKVEMRGGGETPAGERLEARALVRMTIRYRSGITAEMRALWQGRAFNIRNLRDADGRRRFLVLDCEEERP
ncbi:phage head-tail adaptor, putative [Parvibaculum lavamentivorans DS-1]|uniref:Phage head-tail adaptor, putative n=1 Tax=Parvibaculum lavamentivorans (strain DS-1 / DSM 13023 / NCIMB 13966) TaxID=402881 RepID=A7HRJ9_PARL1|nr:phage head closure protein [Parvibaculum lavamentivorans]ABS62532.1 phage head-tail adaptor, putative [Parvibaculum lavamentivorans DS-1]